MSAFFIPGLVDDIRAAERSFSGASPTAVRTGYARSLVAAPTPYWSLILSRGSEIESLRADVRHRRERVALARAKLYRGLGSNTRLQQLERELERAEQPLQHERLHLNTVND